MRNTREVLEAPHIPESEWHPSVRGRTFRKGFFCKNGHDKRVCGVSASLFCLACAASNAKVVRDRKRKEQGRTARNSSNLPGLRYWRTHRGITQYELADMLGSNQWTIHCLEKGTERASMKRRQRLAEVLGVRPGDLMIKPPGKPVELRTNPTTRRWRKQREQQEREEAANRDAQAS